MVEVRLLCLWGLAVRLVHPSCHALALALLEGGGEGAVAAVAALQGQLLGGEGAMGGDGLGVEGDEVVDAQVADIDVVGGTPIGEILAEIGAVGADGLGQLLQRQAVLQVELPGHALLLQQLFYSSEGLPAYQISVCRIVISHIAGRMIFREVAVVQQRHG